MSNVDVLIEKMRSYYNIHGRDDKFISWEDKIVTKNSYTIYEIAIQLNDIINVEKFTDALIATEDYRNIILFACGVKGANISKLTDAIIKSNDPFYILDFMKDVNHANYKKLESAFINLYTDLSISIDIFDYDYIFNFLDTFKNANASKFVDALITKRIYFYDILKFATNFKDRLTHEDIDKLSTAMLSHDFENGGDAFSYAIEFIEKFNPSNISEYIDKTIATKNVYKIYRVLRSNISKQYQEKLTNAFWDNNPSCDMILKYAMYIEKKDTNKCNSAFVGKIQKYVANDWQGFLDNKSKVINIFTKSIIDYAQNVEGADMIALEDTLISFGTAENIYDYLRLVEGANVNRLVDAILSPATKGEYKNSKISIINSIAERIEGADIKKLNEAYISEVEKYIPIVLDKHADLDDSIMLSNNITHYASHVKDADIERLTELMLKIGRGGNLVEFAKKVPNCDVRKIVNFVFNADFPPHIYECRGLVDDEEIIDVLTSPRLVNKFNITMCLFEFAKQGIQVDRIIDAIIRTRDNKYIEKCYNLHYLSEQAKNKLDEYMGVQKEKQEVEDLDNLVDRL